MSHVGNMVSYSETEVDQIIKFACRFWTAGTSAQWAAIAKRPGNDKAGRDSAQKWIITAYEELKINEKIDEVLDMLELFHVHRMREV